MPFGEAGFTETSRHETETVEPLFCLLVVIFHRRKTRHSTSTRSERYYMRIVDRIVDVFEWKPIT